MARQHKLGTIKDVATRIARTGLSTAGHLSERAVDEVTARIAARRTTTSPTQPAAPTMASQAPTTTETGTTTAAVEAPAARRTVPTPADVAQVVARNAAGLARVTPSIPRRKPPKVSAPGAKLPARGGQGILGV